MTPAAELLISCLGDAAPETTEKTRTADGRGAGKVSEVFTGLPAGRAALTVKEFCVWARISRSTFYNLVAANEIRVRKIGNRTVVLCSDALAWLQALPELRVEEGSQAPPPQKRLTKLQHPRHATSQHKKSLVDSIVPFERFVAGSPTEYYLQ